MLEIYKGNVDLSSRPLKASRVKREIENMIGCRTILRNREFIIFSIVIFIDLISKLYANFFLPLEENVSFIGSKVFLYLIYNEGSTGGQANALLQSVPNKNLTLILSSIITLILLIYILFIRKKKLQKRYKILIGIVLFVILNIATEIFLTQYSYLEISSWTTSVIGKITGLTLFGSIFYFAKNKWIRLFLIIILASGVGNLISHFYPPFRIIDFIYVDGLYDLVKIGIFNFADFAFDIGLIGLIISTIVEFVMRLIKRKQIKQPAVEHYE